MEHIDIRLIEKKDFNNLYNVIEKNRKRLLTYFPKTSGSILDLETSKKYTDLKLKQAAKREQLFFVVCLAGTAEIIGGVILKNIDWTVPKGELAYFVDEAYEGKGITAYAVKWLVDYAFGPLEMEKLYIKLNPENAGSKRVAIKNGFEKEGLLKREYRTGGGRLTDVERYGLLKPASISDGKVVVSKSN